MKRKVKPKARGTAIQRWMADVARDNCPTGKRAWKTKSLATMALAKDARREVFKPYRCRHCRRWHLFTIRPPKVDPPPFPADPRDLLGEAGA